MFFLLMLLKYFFDRLRFNDVLFLFFLYICNLYILWFIYVVILIISFMSFVEQLVVALSLCVDSFVVSSACVLHGKYSYGKCIAMSLVFAFFQSVFPLVGSLVGGVGHSVIATWGHWISFGLLFVVGAKMIVDSLKSGDDDNVSSDFKLGTICILGMATSIDAFVVGIGLGFSCCLKEIISVVLLTALATFSVSMAGSFLGKLNIPVPDRVSGVVAGLFLIALGCKFLITGIWG